MGSRRAPESRHPVPRPRAYSDHVYFVYFEDMNCVYTLHSTGIGGADQGGIGKVWLYDNPGELQDNSAGIP